MAADVGQEELEAVGGAGGGGDGGRLLLDFLLGLLGGGVGRGGARLGRPHLEPDRLELARQPLLLLVVQVVLEHERLELRGVDEAALLRALDERLHLVGLKQFDQLVLRQGETSVLSGAASRESNKLTHLMSYFLLLPGEPSPGRCHKLKRVGPAQYSGDADF